MRLYEKDAALLCKQYRSAQPEQLYHLMLSFFHPNKPTADIGCGSGRDLNWLSSHGYPSTGYDPSPAMIAEARAAYTTSDVRESSLPDLLGIPDGSYWNVLCSATIMHVPREDLITAILNLARILKPGGRLILTYRRSRVDGERESDGRLYTDIPPGKMALLLESAGFGNVLRLTQPDSARNDIVWYVFACEKSPLLTTRGLDRIQSVLVQDRKVATYKFALIRALCAVSRQQSSLVRWGKGEVYVPLLSLAVQWLIYYWPLINAPEFVAQLRGEKPGSKSAAISFRRCVSDLSQTVGRDGLYLLLNAIDEEPERYHACLGTIASAIRYGPVTYAGTSGPKLFQYRRRIDCAGSETASAVGPEGAFGWVVVPEPIWLDITRFDHWIEDSIVVRWARLTTEMNPSLTISDVIPLLLAEPGSKRATAEIRDLLDTSGAPLECVWSGASLDFEYHVDHVIPYSVWGNNDLWNMLPCRPQVNSKKSDSLPARSLLLRRRDTIIDYWRFYRSRLSKRFDLQISRALGGAPGRARWEAAAFTGLQETIERLAATRGLNRWEPSAADR